MARSGFGERFPQRDTTATTLLAANVRRLRLAKKMTQDDLAAVLGVEQQMVSLIENARANPAILLVDAIASALGAGMADLFAPPTDPPSTSGKRRGTGH